MKRNKQLNRLHFFKKYSLLLFLFFLPTQLGKHFFLPFSYINGVKVDYLSIIVYFTDFLALGIIFFHVGDLIIFFKRYTKPLTILSFFLGINIILAIYPSLAFYRFFKLMEVFLIALCYYLSPLNLTSVLNAFGLAAALQLFLAMLQLVFKSSLQGAFYFLGERYLSLSHPAVAKTSLSGVELMRPYGTFSHPNSLAGFYLLVFVFFLTMPFDRKYAVWRYVVLVLFSMLIFISFSKIAIIMYLFIIAFYAYKHADFSCKVCTVARATLLIVFSVFFLSASGDPLSLPKRGLLLQNSYEILKNHVFLGVGLGHYLVYEAYNSYAFSYFFLQPVHNIVVLFLAEVGVVAGGVIFYYLWSVFKTRWRREVVFFCLLTIFFTGMFDHYWLTLQQNLLLVGVIFGITFSSQSQ